ncbi:MAG TPA: ABC transporter substrate-binding protein [Candidatus Acidoferrum sp.]|nr:ABC transporter substrate-binding protein [Candidatus Acidoferrum sp.]
MAAFPHSAVAQDAITPQTPYATLDRNGVAYRGPGRESAADLPGATVKIGLLLPLQGASAAEGQSLLAAANMALAEEEAAGTLADGRHLALAVRNQAEQWGQASSEMVQLIAEERVAVLITSSDGNIAHQAEQIANKIGIPIITLASDATSTQINIPWIFRLGPSDEDQARAIASQIYQAGLAKKLLLLVESDHDGRVGGDEFEKAVKHFHGTLPERWEISSSTPDLEAIAARARASAPDTVVLWTSSSLAARLLALLGANNFARPIYLCRKATASVASNAFDLADGGTRAPSGLSQATWVTASPAGATRSDTLAFQEHYRAKTGAWPSFAAMQTYDAVHLVAQALRVAGANRSRLRDYLAAGHPFAGVSGAIVFDPAGNSLGDTHLIRIASTSRPPAL